jgi:hypothetical protein
MEWDIFINRLEDISRVVLMIMFGGFIGTVTASLVKFTFFK